MKALIFVLIICGLSAAPLALAQQSPPSKEVSLSKSQAAEKAQKQVRGRVLKVEQDRDNYRVKVLKKSGRVVSVDVDKKSGQVKRSKKEEKR
ncbi:PepSY domain-containing protein [Salinimonas sp. HHU 13199]|uniref:PepSY domain-containing protein n=1 Tax=Salinimonas profundi TaxID=2729140 RepID=A0ABR8LFM4_9ALTE|nr:PepSY domain-containing protein [Salinimonas profundi]MBD3585059.1 PepSY domain-containing protein [Salinimonas profundi]